MQRALTKPSHTVYLHIGGGGWNAMDQLDLSFDRYTRENISIKEKRGSPNAQKNKIPIDTGIKKDCQNVLGCGFGRRGTPAAAVAAAAARDP